MKKALTAEKLLIEDISRKTMQTKKACKGLSIGPLIRMLRLQLGMPQKILAKKASIRQATLSDIEKEKLLPNLNTLKKIFEALKCELIVSFVLQESIENQRLQQAKKIAKKHIEYLQGTMSLEKQPIDSQMLEEILKKEVNQLLQGPNTKLWVE